MRRRSATAAVLLAKVFLFAVPGLVVAKPACSELGCLEGMTLRRALLELREAGLRVVFSEALVTPELVVAEEPQSRRPRAVLEEVLQDLGLRTRRLADGTLLVVTGATTERVAESTPGGLVRGRVLSSHTEEPVGGALVRLRRDDDPEAAVQTATLANGTFDAGVLEAGTYRLTATHPGHAEAEITGLQVGTEPLSVAVELYPLPLVEDEIVIRSSQIGVHEGPGGPLSLDRDEILRLPHLGNDPLRALALAPGVATDDRSARLRPRGGRSDELMVSLDGQELYRAFHLPDFGDALSLISGDDIASAQLTTGATAAGHGDRLGGLLDLRTRNAQSDFRTSLSASFLTLHGSTAGQAGRAGWLASARRGSVDLSNRVVGQEQPRFWNAFGKLDLDLSRRNRLTARALRANDRLDFDEVDGEESKAFETSYAADYSWATLATVIGEQLLTETTASWTTLDRDRFGAENEEEQQFAVSDVRRSEIARLSQRWSWLLPSGQDLEVGASGTRFDTDFDYASDVERELVLRGPFVVPSERTTEFREALRNDHLAAWASHRSRLHEPLTVELGLRFDRYSLTDEAVWSPRLAAAYRLGPGVLRASWGRYVQSQRPYELAVEDGQSSVDRAERSRQASVGYERTFEEGARLGGLRIEAYDRSVEDPRTQFLSLFEPNNVFPEAEIDRARLEPVRSRRRGLELLLRGSLCERADWWLSTTLASADDRLPLQEGSDVFRDVPRNTEQPFALQAALNLRLPRGLDLSFAWRYHTGWPSTPLRLGRDVDEDGETELFVETGELHSDRLPDLRRLDLRLSRSFTVGRGRLQVFLDVQNAYDRDNLAGFDVSIDEDSETLSIEQETWYGILPSLGVRFTF